MPQGMIQWFVEVEIRWEYMEITEWSTTWPFDSDISSPDDTAGVFWRIVVGTAAFALFLVIVFKTDKTW